MTLDLPPRRELPDEVRRRIRHRVREGMGTPTRSWPHRARVPLAAAGVIALAVGVIVIAPPTSDKATNGPQPSTVEYSDPEMDVTKANAELDRCWAAVRREGQTARFPDRSTWRPVFRVDDKYSPVKVVAARADGRPLFCETTLTSVTVSDPNATPAYVPGSGTGSLLFSANGVIAGVMDPSWRRIKITVDGGGSTGVSEPNRDQMFVFASGFRLDTAKVAVEPTEIATLGPYDTRPAASPLPRAPRPTLSIVDRPVTPVPERSSDAGRFLGDCFSRAREPVADADSYQPGALVAAGASRLVLARNTERIVSCYSMPVQARQSSPEIKELVGFGTGLPLFDLPLDRPVAGRFGGLNVGQGSREVLGGAVPAMTARMELRLAGGAVLRPTVANGTFAVLLPAGRHDLHPDTVQATLYNAGGERLYAGRLPFWTR